MDWQGHTLEPPYQFRLVSLQIMGCRYLILETETCPWNMRAFTNIYKVTKPDGSKKNPYVKYIRREVQAYLFLFLISKFLSTEQMKENPHKFQTKSKQIPSSAFLGFLKQKYRSHNFLK